MEANEEARASFYDPNLEMYMMHEGLLQWREPGGWLLTGAEGKKGGRQARRGSHQKQKTMQALLPAADQEHGTWLQPSRKSKRVELKKKKQQQQTMKQRPIERAVKEDNSDQDAEADDDDDYQGAI